MSWQERLRQSEDGSQALISRRILAVSKPYHDALASAASELLVTGKATKVAETVNRWGPLVRYHQTDNYVARWSQYGVGPGNKAARFELSTHFTVIKKDISLDSFTSVIIGSGSQSLPVQLDLSFGRGMIHQASLSWKAFYQDTCLYLLDGTFGDLIKEFYVCARTAEGVNWGKFFLKGSRGEAEYNYPASVTTYSISGSAIKLDLGASPTIELAQDIISQEEFSERFVKGGGTQFGSRRKNVSYIYDGASNKFLSYVHGPVGADNPQVYNGEAVVREMAGWPQRTTRFTKEEMTVEEYVSIYRSLLALIPIRTRTESSRTESYNSSARATDGNRFRQRDQAGRKEQSPFEVLEISETATPDEINQARRRQILIYHPDLIRGVLEKAGIATNDPRRRYFEQAAGERMRKINAAFLELRSRGRV